MRITTVTPRADLTLLIATGDGRRGVFDVCPYLQYEAFA